MNALNTGMRKFQPIVDALVSCALCTLVGCSTAPRIDTDSGGTQSGIDPGVLVDAGRRTANRKEYNDLLEVNAPETATRAML
ncbi:MAG TPA: hypothetical protein VET88_10975, partial [Gammaproteobacteria bacterium]|nr:hypothetical protein [Gammaproteobacteria bacterium]